MTERDIQNYIWEHRDEFDTLLQPISFPQRPAKSPWEYSPTEILYYHLIDKYKRIWEAIEGLDMFGCEVPLKKDGDSTIRADFLGILEGENGIVIVELKKGEQTERQAYTELLAYGNHIRNLFPPMCKADVVYLLIAPMKERIVREATVHTILYDHNSVCALIPSWDDDISTLKLNLWIPTIEDICQISEECFTEANFDVFKIAWDSLPGIWSPSEDGEEPDEDMKARLNNIASMAAQIMEEQRNSKFKIMADYATNLFFASTENERDLDKVETFLDDNFADSFIERSEDMLDAQFSSLWVYPEKEIDKLVASLEAKDEIYIRILTYALKDEYVSFRTFSQGTWNIKF